MAIHILEQTGTVMMFKVPRSFLNNCYFEQRTMWYFEQRAMWYFKQRAMRYFDQSATWFFDQWATRFSAHINNLG